MIGTADAIQNTLIDFANEVESDNDKAWKPEDLKRLQNSIDKELYEEPITLSEMVELDLRKD